MATRNEIVGELARGRVVEQMVCSIVHSDMTPDLEDLSQFVYLVLLKLDEDKLADLWNNGHIRYFIARVIINNWRASRSAYRNEITKFRSRSVPLEGADFIDEATADNR